MDGKKVETMNYFPKIGPDSLLQKRKKQWQELKQKQEQRRHNC